MQIIHLHEIGITLSSSPHRDIPDHSKLAAQIIIGQKIFVQTISSSSLDDRNNSWNLTFQCNIPPDTAHFSIAVLREWPATTKVMRLLGTVDMIGAEIIPEMKAGRVEEITSPLTKVNKDGPTLVLSAKLSVLSWHASYGTGTTDVQSKVHASLDNEDNLVSSNLTSICTRLDRMFHSALSDQPVDPLDISVMHERLLLLSPSHATIQAKYLNTLGVVCSQEHRSYKVDDLNRAAITYDDAMRIAAANGYFELTYWVDVGICLLARFECVGDLADLNKSIEVLEDAVLFTPDQHPYKANCLSSLGNSLSCRFEQEGHLADLHRCTQVHHESVSLTPGGHPAMPLRLNNLGNSLMRRYERLGDIADLNRSIEVKKEAVQLTPSGHPAKASYVNNLVASLMYRFQNLGEVADLNDSIQGFEDAVRLTDNRDPDKIKYLNNLADALGSRYERLEDPADMNRSIQVCEDAIRLTPKGHPDVPHNLARLGQQLLQRFQNERVEESSLTGLNRAIQLCEDAIALFPNRHPGKLTVLNTLGSSLVQRFHWRGDLADLHRSIQVKEDALLLFPDDHPDKYVCLHNLGNSFSTRFEQLGDLADLKRAVQVEEEALFLIPNGHSNKPKYLTSLGGLLQDRFKQLGDYADLNRSIQLCEDAVLLASDGQSKPTCLQGLSIALECRFEALGDLADLDRSIRLCEDALLLTSNQDHPSRYAYLLKLGNSLLHRFRQSGDLSDSIRSMQLFEDAILLLPDKHSQKPLCLNSLGNSLMYRFLQMGDLDDLNRSIQVYEDTLLLIPEQHFRKPDHLGNLGRALLCRFLRLGNLSDLNRSIQFHEEAVKLTSNAKPSYLADLGSSLSRRFEQLGDLHDLAQSIQALEDAVRLASDTDIEKHSHLQNLGNSLMQRFERLGDWNDFNRSIEVREDAIRLTPAEHPDRVIHLSSLGSLLQTRFEQHNNLLDLSAAISHYSSAAQSITGAPNMKFLAASRWVLCVIKHQPHESMKACTVAVNLVPHLTWFGLSIRDWHHALTKAGQIVRLAAAAALSVDQYDTAVEWLEQGRSVTWSQLLELRSPINELSQTSPTFANRLQFLSSRLEGATSRGIVGPYQQSSATVDYHELAREREELLHKIRSLPGFERFLLPKKFSELLPAADRGPVVMLNISTLRCDALVLMPGLDDVLDVQLKDLTLEEAWVWREMFQIVRSNDSDVVSLTDLQIQLIRKGTRVPDHGMVLSREEVLGGVLGMLWHCICKPILDALAIITNPIEPLSQVQRIWWCPTGPLTFLPIHAAGIYPSGPKLSDFVVSSYTPTLNTLLDKYRPGPSIFTQRQLLTVALPSESHLPGTAKELERIVQHADKFNVLRLFESQATRQRVSEAMKTSSWVHFACHGIQNSSSPTDSCLALAHGSKLTISEIIKLSLENAELAFLSACETATGDRELEEEAVHLAAGMLFAGYRGVVATMWTIHDDVAVQVADETYRRLFKEYDADPARAAEALHFAIKKVCEDANGKLSLFSWVPFIHMGI